MEEPLGAQYAVHIAMITLKDRCKNLQQRVTFLEEENLNLRLQCTRNTERNQSFTEREQFQQQIAELTEQKQQLIDKVRMVTSENKELWNRLSKLNKINQNLGVQLSKINDSLEQHTTKNRKNSNTNDNQQQHTTLVRSKTFTQDEAHTKFVQKNLEENSRISTELEEISLKIINSLTQGKLELDSLYSDIADVQYNDNIITDSCGFYFDEFDGNIFDEFTTIIDELKTTKQTVVKQGELLKNALEMIKQLQEEQSNCDKFGQEKESMDKSTSVSLNDLDVPNADRDEDSDDSGSKTEQSVEKICPICSKTFTKDTNFEALTIHVEQHFIETNDFEML